MLCQLCMRQDALGFGLSMLTLAAFTSRKWCDVYIMIPWFMNDANCQLFDCLWQSMLVAMSVSLARCLRELHWSVVTPSSVSQIRLPSAPAPKEHRFENQRSQPVTGRHLKTSHFRDLPRPSEQSCFEVTLTSPAMRSRASEESQAWQSNRNRAIESRAKKNGLQRVSTKVGCPDPIISYHTKDSLFILYGLLNAKDHESNHPVVSYQPSQTHLTLHLLAFGFCILVLVDRFFTLSK